MTVPPQATPSLAFTSRSPAIVILGSDAVLAALPATPVQLAHACLRAGFQTVVPASWGDELVAGAMLKALEQRRGIPAVQCSCPLVAHRLLSVGTELHPFLVPLVAPPVALARYLRALHGGAQPRITYVGRCPGAEEQSIDARLTPDELLVLFVERRIALLEQPLVFDSVIPPDRRRHLSQPGGVPSAEALWVDGGNRMLEELSGENFPIALAQLLLSEQETLVNPAPALGCACAGAITLAGGRNGRAELQALEPPRSHFPVVDARVPVELELSLLALQRPAPPPQPRQKVEVQSESRGEAAAPAMLAPSVPAGAASPGASAPSVPASTSAVPMPACASEPPASEASAAPSEPVVAPPPAAARPRETAPTRVAPAAARLNEAAPTRVAPAAAEREPDLAIQEQARASVPLPDEMVATEPRREQITAVVTSVEPDAPAAPTTGAPPFGPHRRSPVHGIPRTVQGEPPMTRQADGRQLPRTYVLRRRNAPRTAVGALQPSGIAQEEAAALLEASPAAAEGTPRELPVQEPVLPIDLPPTSAQAAATHEPSREPAVATEVQEPPAMLAEAPQLGGERGAGNAVRHAPSSNGSGHGSHSLVDTVSPAPVRESPVPVTLPVAPPDDAPQGTAAGEPLRRLRERPIRLPLDRGAEHVRRTTHEQMTNADRPTTPPSTSTLPQTAKISWPLVVLMVALVALVSAMIGVAIGAYVMR